MAGRRASPRLLAGLGAGLAGLAVAGAFTVKIDMGGDGGGGGGMDFGDLFGQMMGDMGGGGEGGGPGAGFFGAFHAETPGASGPKRDNTISPEVAEGPKETVSLDDGDGGEEDFQIYQTPDRTNWGANAAAWQVIPPEQAENLIGYINRLLARAGKAPAEPRDGRGDPPPWADEVDEEEEEEEEDLDDVEGLGVRTDPALPGAGTCGADEEGDDVLRGPAAFEPRGGGDLDGECPSVNFFHVVFDAKEHGPWRGGRDDFKLAAPWDPLEPLLTALVSGPLQQYIEDEVVDGEEKGLAPSKIIVKRHHVDMHLHRFEASEVDDLGARHGGTPSHRTGNYLTFMLFLTGWDQSGSMEWMESLLNFGRHPNWVCDKFPETFSRLAGLPNPYYKDEEAVKGTGGAAERSVWKTRWFDLFTHTFRIEASTLGTPGQECGHFQDPNPGSMLAFPGDRVRGHLPGGLPQYVIEFQFEAEEVDPGEALEEVDDVAMVKFMETPLGPQWLNMYRNIVELSPEAAAQVGLDAILPSADGVKELLLAIEIIGSGPVGDGSGQLDETLLLAALECLGWHLRSPVASPESRAAAVEALRGLADSARHVLEKVVLERGQTSPVSGKKVIRQHVLREACVALSYLPCGALNCRETAPLCSEILPESRWDPDFTGPLYHEKDWRLADDPEDMKAKFRRKQCKEKFREAGTLSPMEEGRAGWTRGKTWPHDCTENLQRLPSYWHEPSARPPWAPSAGR